MRITAPHLFGSFLQSSLLKRIIGDQYQKQKTKRISILRENFFTSWYDIQWWSKKLRNDQEQFEAQKDKSLWFSKFFNAYRKFTTFGRFYQTFKSMYDYAKNSQGIKALFGRKYNLYNESDYRDFQTNLSRALGDSLGVIQAGLMTWFKPTLLELRATILIRMQKLWDAFSWWLFRQVFWGNNWVDIIFSIIGYGLTALGFIFSGGTSSAIALGQWGYRAAKVGVVLKRIFGVFSTAVDVGKYTKSIGALAKTTNLGRKSRSLVAWGKRAQRASPFAKAIKRVNKAKERLNQSKWVKRALSSPVKFHILHSKLTDYDMVKSYFYRRGKLMYMGMQGELTRMQYSIDALGDIFGGAKRLAQRGIEGYIAKRYHDNVVNKKYGLQMEISKKEYQKYPFFTTLEKLTTYFEKLVGAMMGENDFDKVFSDKMYLGEKKVFSKIGTFDIKTDDMISWHDGGKKLVIQILGSDKLQVVTDGNGAVLKVIIGSKIIDWTKEANGYTSSGLISGFEWKHTNAYRHNDMESTERKMKQTKTKLDKAYTSLQTEMLFDEVKGGKSKWEKAALRQELNKLLNTTTDESIKSAAKKYLALLDEYQGYAKQYRKKQSTLQYFRRMKVSLGAKITLNGIDLGFRKRHEIKYDGEVVLNVITNKSTIDINPEEEYILGDDFEGTYEKITNHSKRQILEERKITEKLQQMLKIINDKLTIEGQYVDEIMEILTTMQYYDVQGTQTITMHGVMFTQTRRVKDDIKIGYKDIMQIKQRLSKLKKEGKDEELQRIKNALIKRLKKKEGSNVYYSQRRVITSTGRGRVVSTDVEQNKLFVRQIHDIITKNSTSTTK